MCVSPPFSRPWKYPPQTPCVAVSKFLPLTSNGGEAPACWRLPARQQPDVTVVPSAPGSGAQPGWIVAPAGAGRDETGSRRSMGLGSSR